MALRHQGVYAWLTVEQHAGLHCPTTLVAGHAACCALHACVPPPPHMMGTCAAQALAANANASTYCGSMAVAQVANNTVCDQQLQALLAITCK